MQEILLETDNKFFDDDLINGKYETSVTMESRAGDAIGCFF